MLDSASREFRSSYFISAQLPTYILAIIVLIIKHIEETGQLFPIDLFNFTSLKLTVLILILCILISICCLFGLNKRIKDVKEFRKSKSGGKNGHKVELNGEYNEGMRDFLLSVLIPVVTTVSVFDSSPVTGIITCLILQVIMYIFFMNSSEYLPNLSLFLIKYSVIKGKDSEKDKEVILLVNKKNEVIGTKNEVQIIYFGKNSSMSKFGLVVEE